MMPGLIFGIFLPLVISSCRAGTNSVNEVHPSHRPGKCPGITALTQHSHSLVLTRTDNKEAAFTQSASTFSAESACTTFGYSVKAYFAGKFGPFADTNVWFVSRNGRDKAGCGRTFLKACFSLNYILGEFQKNRSEVNCVLNLATDKDLLINNDLFVSSVLC